MDKKDYPQHYLEKNKTFKNLFKVHLWFDKGQFGGQKVEFGVNCLIPCLQSTTGRFSCMHSQNDLPIDFGLLEK